MSYGLNIEMHKQVGSQILTIDPRPPPKTCSHLEDLLCSDGYCCMLVEGIQAHMSA